MKEKCPSKPGDFIHTGKRVPCPINNDEPEFPAGWGLIDGREHPDTTIARRTAELEKRVGELEQALEIARDAITAGYAAIEHVDSEDKTAHLAEVEMECPVCFAAKKLRLAKSNIDAVMREGK